MATKHTHQMVFGKRVAGCPRCAELNAGAPVVVWRESRAQQDQRQVREVRAHFDGEYHRSGKCGPVCTFGDR